jgi:phospholipase C
VKFAAKSILLLVLASASLLQAQIRNFGHIIIIVQENRTPDNLFQGLCTPPYGTAASCSTSPVGKQYDIQTKNWLDKTSATGVTQPTTTALAGKYDLGHAHHSWVAQCDKDAAGNCRMDGAAKVQCKGITCPVRAALAYVDNSTGNLNPYLHLATQYGWANAMFQTNQGPSFPAHQFIFSGTSAPSLADDHAGTFAAENMNGKGSGAGCIATSTRFVQLITANGAETSSNRIFPCFDHNTVADLLQPRGITWKYYSAGANSIWTAPNAIQHLCMASGTACAGADWKANVDLNPAHVLTDIASCSLRQVTWVTPSGQNSDHAATNTGGGPSWVASIVNAIGTSWTASKNKCDYWANNSNDATAILIVWDDWGGWYDHKPPATLPAPQGGYQLGFRVPFIAVSAYTPVQLVDNNRHDFGSIVRFIEHNFAIPEGALTFADARAGTDLTSFFDLNQAARGYGTVAAKVGAAFFINDKTPPTDPDDD